jgi:hypothetical protein
MIWADDLELSRRNRIRSGALLHKPAAQQPYMSMGTRQQPRKPAGTPVGGQFAPTAHDEDDIYLGGRETDMTTTPGETVSDLDIEQLRQEAAQHGDPNQVALCEAALRGDSAARKACVGVLKYIRRESRNDGLDSGDPVRDNVHMTTTGNASTLIELSPELWGDATELTDLPALEKAAKLVISEHYPSAQFHDVRRRDGVRVGFRVESDEWDEEWWNESGSLEAQKRAILPEPVSITPMDLDDITASDLKEWLIAAEQPWGLPTAYAFRVDIAQNGVFGNQPHAEALFIPDRGRVGIAYGATAQWADVLPEDYGKEYPEATIALWHADNDAYAARN